MAPQFEAHSLPVPRRAERQMNGTVFGEVRIRRAPVHRVDSASTSLDTGPEFGGIARIKPGKGKDHPEIRTRYPDARAIRQQFERSVTGLLETDRRRAG